MVILEEENQQEPQANLKHTDGIFLNESWLRERWSLRGNSRQSHTILRNYFL